MTAQAPTIIESEPKRDVRPSPRPRPTPYQRAEQPEQPELAGAAEDAPAAEQASELATRGTELGERHADEPEEYRAAS